MKKGTFYSIIIFSVLLLTSQQNRLIAKKDTHPENAIPIEHVFDAGNKKEEDALNVAPHHPKALFKTVNEAIEYLGHKLLDHPEASLISFHRHIMAKLIRDTEKNNLRHGFPVNKEFRHLVSKLDASSKKLFSHIIKQAHILTKDPNPKKPFSNESKKYLKEVVKLLLDNTVITHPKEIAESMRHIERPHIDHFSPKTLSGKIKIHAETAVKWVTKTTQSLWKKIKKLF
ncbi:hypothetical protein HN446_03155 [bacterium]|jgi:hypothetical protein|nr:hypothetical protein [bacterium]